MYLSLWTSNNLWKGITERNSTPWWRELDLRNCLKKLKLDFTRKLENLDRRQTPFFLSFFLFFCWVCADDSDKISRSLTGCLRLRAQLVELLTSWSRREAIGRSVEKQTKQTNKQKPKTKKDSSCCRYSLVELPQTKESKNLVVVVLGVLHPASAPLMTNTHL